MPYNVREEHCRRCPSGAQCVEDRRDRPVPGRDTVFRFLQNNAIACTFDSFVPGEEGSPGSFGDYLNQVSQNVKTAAEALFQAGGEMSVSQIAKSEGDILERIISAILWNVAVDWNVATKPKGGDNVAFINVPRGYDVTRLLTPSAATRVHELHRRLDAEGMELRLSAPDILCVRLPNSLDGEAPRESLRKVGDAEREYLENYFTKLEGKLEGSSFLLAIAVKKSARSDRLYQPLFEANVLKYIVRVVLGYERFKFISAFLSIEGADVRGRYNSVAMFSLPTENWEKAVDRLLILTTPQELKENVKVLLAGAMVPIAGN